MKKRTPQIVVAIVCGILGFLLMYQYKSSISRNEAIGYNRANIASDVELLKKDKEELTNTNTQLSDELKKIEETATEETASGQSVKDKLNTARIQLGLLDVTGDGIQVTIKPKVSMFGATSKDNNGKLLSDKELVHLIGALWFSGAEAISINDLRITPQTGISISGTQMAIGSAGMVNPGDVIVVKAIGDKEKMNDNMNIEYNSNTITGALTNYNINFEKQSGIIIEKTTESIQSGFLNAVNTK